MRSALIQSEPIGSMMLSTVGLSTTMPIVKPMTNAANTRRAGFTPSGIEGKVECIFSTQDGRNHDHEAGWCIDFASGTR